MSPQLLVFPRLLGLLAVVAVARVCAAPQVQALPAWVLEAAARPTPATVAGAPALVLLDEWAYDIQPDGRVVHTRRYAVRVLNRSGSEQARCSVNYLEKNDTVTASTAWLVRAGKEVRAPKPREWIDASAASGGAIFDESRARAISYEDLAFAGDVFACETRVERRLLFGQLASFWRAWMPTLVDRCVVRLPLGWSCTVVTEGTETAALKASVAGQTWTWDLNDRPYRPDEPAMADEARLDARVLINLVPPADAKGLSLVVPRDWAAVVTWDLNNSLGRCDSDPALVADARKLTAGCADPLSRIRALSRYVQQLRYVGVNKDLALGSGYRPRKATEVHSKGWGDCKDKANLLVAMLREVGVEAFSVTAQSGGGRLVNPDWPSLRQFNHAIVGIRIADSIVLPAVADVAGVGRLLFFDATDPDVLLGDLPWYLQGTKVYVVAPGITGLTTLPILPTDPSHLFETRVRITLASDGSVTGDCSIGGPGRAGADCRTKERRLSAKELREKMGELLNGTVRGAVVKDVTSTDDPIGGDHRIGFAFTSPRFGQRMPGGLTLVRLDVMNRDSVPAFPEKERKLPIGILPILVRDSVTLQLPAGVVVEELPDRAELSSPYGRYESSYEKADGVVIAHRSLQLEDCIVPVAEYAALRKFLGDVAKADHSSVVLRQAETAPATAAAK